MYGKWFLFAFGFALLVLFAIGMIATAYAPIFAVGIVLLVVAFLLGGMATRRSSQIGVERSSAAQERREAGQRSRPSTSAAPRGGEGEAGQAHRAALTRGDRA